MGVFQKQPLVESINALLKFYDKNVDFRGVFKDTALNYCDITADDLQVLCEKTGLEARRKKRDFSHIAKQTNPTILLLENGDVCVFLPAANERGQFIFPESFSGEKTVQFLAQSYCGDCFDVVPIEHSAKLDISHMHVQHSLDWFWKPIISFWDRYAEVLLCSVFINLLALAIPLYTMNIYDRVVINFVEDTLIVFTIGVFTAILFDFFFKTLRAYIIERIAVQVSGEYDVKLMERMLHIKDVDLQLNTGEKSNLFRELQGVRDLFASRLVPAMVDIPFTVMFIFIIYLIAPNLALIPVVISLVVIGISYFAQSLIGKYTKQYFTAIQNKTGFLIEMLEGLSTIKMLGGGGHKLFQWQQATCNAARASSCNNMILATVSNFSLMLTQIGQALIVFYGAYSIHEGTLTVGGLVACSIIYGRAISSIVSMTNVYSRLKQSNDVLKTIDKLFEIPHEDLRPESLKSAKGPYKGKIEIKDLTYQYPQQSRPALHQINLEVHPGNRIGLLGKTGAGKSTLTQIITGQISANEGNVFLDDYSYNSIAPTDLRRAIGYVPQHPYFFSGSIQDNILMGDNDISKAQLDEVVQLAGLDLVIQQTSEGLDMDVGEGGKRLSGGQRQSIALARALVRSPDMLVFDEPTNAMDNSLEERIKNTLASYIKGRTFILVTHRTTLLPLVSRLLLLDQGRVVADGAKDDILKKLSK